MLRVGPAGWAYNDWRGIVYPRNLKSSEHLSFIAEYFDVVEINTSFYNPIAAATAKDWCRKVEANPRFRFTAKMFRAVTHTREQNPQVDANIRDGFTPLLESGSLGAVLLQFPSAFHHGPESRAYLVSLHRRFREFPLVLEVRHSSWNEPGVLAFLADLNIGLCNIDQPLFDTSLGPDAAATSAVGYVRLHGRNYKAWWTENKYAGERYDYLYSLNELGPWVDRIKAIDAQSEDTYVITNNHFVGKAVVNAIELEVLIRGESILAPQTLVDHYPELNELTTRTPQGQLGFDLNPTR